MNKIWLRKLKREIRGTYLNVEYMKEPYIQQIQYNIDTIKPNLNVEYIKIKQKQSVQGKL